MNEFAALLYDKVNNLEQEGLKHVYLMQQNTSHFSGCGNYGKVRPRSRTYNVLSLFFMLIAFKGLDTKKAELGWYLPRKNNLMSTDYPPCFKTPT
jgi:hypothetical protein